MLNYQELIETRIKTKPRKKQRQLLGALLQNWFYTEIKKHQNPLGRMGFDTDHKNLFF